MRYKPHGLPETPYLKAKEIWDNRIGSARHQAWNWRLAFFGALAVCFVLVLGLIYLSTKSTVVPFIVEVGQGGEVLAVTKAVQANRSANDAEIKYFLTKWIRDVRQVPLDVVIKKQSWLSAYGCMRQSAALKMNEYVKAEDPMARIGRETVSITPTAILKMSDKTFQVRWTENVFSKDGSAKESYRMTALVTIDFSKPATEKDMLANPLGLFISDFSWSKEM